MTTRENYFTTAGDYGYWKPVLYHCEDTGVTNKFLKIELAGDTQIGRIEITHPAEQP